MTYENPYSSVKIPRAHLQDLFPNLGQDNQGFVLSNSDAVLAGPTYMPKKYPERNTSEWNGGKISTQESWGRSDLYNPYGSLKPYQSDMHVIERRTTSSSKRDGCCACCCEYCPCCRKCCCVVS